MNLHIAGGTYRERCMFPEWNELFGSGLRAAVLADSLGAKVVFHTFVGEMDESTLEQKATRKIKTKIRPTSPTISFNWVHSLSPPQIWPHVLKLPQSGSIVVEAPRILRFGMLEGDAVVKGKRVVYDPQDPFTPVCFNANGSMADHLAIVLNRTEASKLSGVKGSIAEIAKTLRKKEKAEVAVIKCGSEGCFVSSSEAEAWLPSFQTSSVWLIGSGDVFAAAFTVFWAVEKKAPVEAAELASKATAVYCSSMNAAVPKDFLSSFAFPPFRRIDRQEKPLIYLAGPFFTMAERWLIEEARRCLIEQGLDVFSPFHDVGVGEAFEIYEPDIEGVKRCAAVLAIVDGLDAGTLFEIGFAASLQRPIVALVQNEKAEDLKMLVGYGCEIEHDFATAIYKTFWRSMS